MLAIMELDWDGTVLYLWNDEIRNGGTKARVEESLVVPELGHGLYDMIIWKEVGGNQKFGMVVRLMGDFESWTC